VGEYIALQQKRFGDRIRFRLHCGPDARDIQIPPLIIQPFVENSVCHGLEPKVEGGIVCVDIKARNGRYVIRILDTGIGMDAETKASLTENRSDLMEGYTHGIGIRNVLKRLNLYYSGEERSVMYSKQGRGTLTVLSIPSDRKA